MVWAWLTSTILSAVPWTMSLGASPALDGVFLAALLEHFHFVVVW
jgi:hypothetical protein